MSLANFKICQRPICQCPHETDKRNDAFMCMKDEYFQTQKIRVDSSWYVVHSIVDGIMTHHNRIYRHSIFTIIIKPICIGFITLAFLEMVSFGLIDARTSASVKEQYEFIKSDQDWNENP